MKKVLIVCGPTASGKTALSISLAKKLNSEVISADSMNVYKKLNIGTAKPTKEEMGDISHYMIDVVDPKDNFSVGDYKDMAEPILADIQNRNLFPIICGGTCFYINSLVFDYSYASKSDLTVRKKYFDLYEKFGADYIYDLLKKNDFESSKIIHKNDVKRVIRALEIFDSGLKKSELNDSLKTKRDFLAVMIDYDRELLYERINKRVDIMFKNGLVDEVKQLLDSGIDEKSQCFQGIGYKEIIPYLHGDVSFEDTKELIKLNTRHYAKRQITFFKKLNPVLIKPDEIEIMTKKVIDLL